MLKSNFHFLLKKNIDVRKVIISHTALADDFDLILYLVQNGINIAFDTIGKIGYLTDEKRIEYIRKLCDMGYVKQLLFSMDLTRKSHLKKNGGPGYAYLLEKFIPELIKANVKEEDIKTILCCNFERILRV